MKDNAEKLSSVELEQQILGNILANNERFHDIGGRLKAEHFADPVHARIWEHIASRIRNDNLASPVTLRTELGNDPGLTQLGGPAYLARLVGASMAGFAIKDYAKELIEVSARRELSGRLEQLSEEAWSRPSAEIMAELEIINLERADDDDNPRAMSMLAAQTRAIMQRQEIQQGKLVGVPTGLKTLDEVLSLMPKRYTLLGGTTSMGKTALAVWITYAAAKAGFGVGFDTLEMPEEDLANRTNSIDSGIPYKAYDRMMSENLFRKTIEAAKAQENLPIEIFSGAVRDVPAILSEAKKLKRKWKPRGDFKGLKLLVVDYIQIVDGKGESSLARLSKIANDFKQVAKALDVHVICLAQVDRKIGDRENTRPKLSDLRGSADLENAPDNVIFIHRPQYFHEREMPPKKAEDRADWEVECERWRNKAEIIIGKARMGEITSVTVGCDIGTNRFYDIEDQEGFEF